VLADAVTLTVFTLASPPLVLADAAAATGFALASHPLMLANADATTFCTQAVFAQGHGLAGPFGCSRMEHWSLSLDSYAVWAVSTLLFPLALLLLPPDTCVLIRLSLLAGSSSLSALRADQHHELLLLAQAAQGSI